MSQFRKKRYINEQESYHCYSCDTNVNIAHYEYIQDGKVSRIYRCGTCGLMFAKPMLLDEISSRQLDSIGDGELFHNNLMKKLHEHLIINKEIRSVKKLLGRDTFTALDIGCGTGWISSLWKHAGADVVGLEPSTARSSYAREHYGLKVISSCLEDLSSGDTYDGARPPGHPTGVQPYPDRSAVSSTRLPDASTSPAPGSNAGSRPYKASMARGSGG